MRWLFPIVVQLPLAVTLGAVTLPLRFDMEIVGLNGSLQALVAGTFSVAVKDDGGNTIGTLSWQAPGNQSVDAGSFVRTDQLTFDVTSVGIGALGCYVAVWCNLGVI